MFLYAVNAMTIEFAHLYNKINKNWPHSEQNHQFKNNNGYVFVFIFCKYGILEFSVIMQVSYIFRDKYLKSGVGLGVRF